MCPSCDIAQSPPRIMYIVPRPNLPRSAMFAEVGAGYETNIERERHVFPRDLWTGHVHYRICTLLHGHTVKWPFTTIVNTTVPRGRRVGFFS